MGPTDGFRIDADELARLATDTHELAADVRTAAGRARPIHVPSYGSVGATFGETALSAATTAGEAIADVVEATERAAGALRAALAGYLSAETAATTAFDGLAR